MSLYQALLNNQSGLGSLSLFSLPFTTEVGEVSNDLPAIDPKLSIYKCRNARVALAALNQPQDGLRKAIEVAKTEYGPERIGVVIGTSTSGLYETEKDYRFLLSEGKMPEEFNFLTRHAYQATAQFIQQELQLKGPCYAISTACSSSGKALGAARRLINTGICDAVISGGVDTLCQLTLRGFFSLDLISEQRCAPMDAARNGISIGEGAGLLLLEKMRPQFEGAPCLIGAGESSDAHHMSAPHPDGEGAIAAMSSALEQAELGPTDIDYINLHATATPLNDLIEARAVCKLFGGETPCSGTKGLTGHTLGAAGAIEAIVSLIALEHGFIPGNCGLNRLDPQCQCKVPAHPVPNTKLKAVMSNAFGFGGNNVSLIFSYAG